MKIKKQNTSIIYCGIHYYIFKVSIINDRCINCRCRYTTATSLKNKNCKNSMAKFGVVKLYTIKDILCN